MDYRSILNFVNSPGTDVQQPSPTSSDVSYPSYGDADPNNNVVKTCGKPICGGCCITIRDRWILKVGDQPYHMACLRCSVCLRTLDNHMSCFIRDNAVYCRFHYVREYGTQCSGCHDYLLPTDWIQKARDLTYHVTCFRCYVCKRQLFSGDMVVAKDDYIVCYEHRDTCLQMDEIDSVSVSSMDSDSRGSDFDERVTKRARSVDPETKEHEERGGGRRTRSTFTPDQVLALQAAFSHKSMLSSDEMSTLASRLGLKKRVVGIWFQNARARSKKMQAVGTHLSRKSGKVSRYPNSPLQPILVE